MADPQSSGGHGHLYLLALGSNQRHPRLGSPRKIIEAASEALDDIGTVSAMSHIVDSDPVGPSRRCFANAALVLNTKLEPDELLGELKAIERKFGRRKGKGQRWGARALDLDIVLWSDGIYASPDLLVPHPEFRRRDFVLRPMLAIAREWRDPVGGLSIAQLHARLTRPRPLPR